MAVDFATLQGHDVVGADGSKIGKVADIYNDDRSGRPVFATVRTGLFGTKSSFVPLNDATVRGDDLAVPYTKEKVKDAPAIEDDESITLEEEKTIYLYYDLPAEAPAAAGETTGRGTGTTGFSETESRRGERRPDTAADQSMTRSEERVRVGTETVETGRAHLRKYVVTEQVTQTVPVRKEKVRVEREPLTDADRRTGSAESQISEADQEVILHEERPVVAKETVPVERVRMDVETETDQETVSEEVRKERIDVDDAARDDRRRR